MSDSTLQYIRNFKLIVSSLNGTAVDLSPLHCKFSIKRSSGQTPNSAEVRVYNLSNETENSLKSMLAPIAQNDGILTATRGNVTIQGGYDANFGVVFQGNIKQIILGRESATDTFMDLICGDGDFAYNYAVVKGSIGGNGITYTQEQILGQITGPMQPLGVTTNHVIPVSKKNPTARGRSYWGNARKHLRTFAQTNGLTWSIQNGEVSFVSQQGYAPGVAVVLTSKTGMIGTPQQTSQGVNVVCLMNPLISPGRAIKIDNKSIAGLKIDLGNPNSPVNVAPPLRADGVYTVLVVETTGDNRGIDWYSKLVCLSINASEANLINSVPVSYGP